jgi:ABC-type spermidine/putrescine transport system permease subunit I
MKRFVPVTLLLPSFVLVGCFVVVPLMLVIRVSLFEPALGRGFYQPGTLTSVNYATVWSGDELRIITFTLRFACAVSLVSVTLSYGIALFSCSLSRSQQFLTLALVFLPKTGGLLATLFGLQRLLPRGWWAALVTEVYFILPYTALVVALQLRAIEPHLVAAARGLGASRWQAYRKITLPLSWPGLRVALQLSFLWGLGAFLGPLFLGGPDETTLAVELHRQAFDYNRWPRAAAEAVSLLVLAFTVVAGLAFVRRGDA